MSEHLELLWAGAEHWQRLERHPELGPLLRDTVEGNEEQSPPGQGYLTPEQSIRLSAVLGRASRSGEGEVRNTLSAAVHGSGNYLPPLLAFGGLLEFPFDELEALRVTTATLSALGPSEGLLGSIAVARDFASQPLASAEIAATLTRNLDEAFQRSRPRPLAEHVQRQIQRALLLQRRYQQRTFQGRPHVRGLLQSKGDARPMLVYLPVDAADALPLFTQFEVRALARAHYGTDEPEPYPFALELVALARVVKLGGWSRAG